jgi:hypothetical protein
MKIRAGLLWLGLLLLTEEARAQITPPPSGGGGGTPGGSNTQVQYNKAGAFGGIPGATSDGTSLLVTTQAVNDTSTAAASDAFVATAIANAVAGINPAVAVQAATTSAANTSGFTYNNGVSGVGATFTGTANTAVTIDGFTFTALGQRLLVKNDTQSPSGAFNGIYYVTQLQTSLLPPILTRALDYDQPSDMNNTGAIPVVNGTVNALTSWLLTSQVTTVGTSPLTYTQFSFTPSPQQFQLVGTATLSGGAAGTTGTGFAIITTAGTTCTFSAIPQTFNNLMLVVCARTTRSAVNDNVLVGLNGDVSTDYNLQQAYVGGSSAVTGGLTNATTPAAGGVSGATATAARCGCFTSIIAAYAGTTFQKIINTAGSYDAGVSGLQSYTTSLNWINNAAVTSIVLTPLTGPNFVVGSSFYLYAC